MAAALAELYAAWSSANQLLPAPSVNGLVRGLETGGKGVVILDPTVVAFDGPDGPRAETGWDARSRLKTTVPTIAAVVRLRPPNSLTPRCVRVKRVSLSRQPTGLGGLAPAMTFGP